jgi:hypothetical protein
VGCERRRCGRAAAPTAERYMHAERLGLRCRDRWKGGLAARTHLTVRAGWVRARQATRVASLKSTMWPSRWVVRSCVPLLEGWGGGAVLGGELGRRRATTAAAGLGSLSCLVHGEQQRRCVGCGSTCPNSRQFPALNVSRPGRGPPPALRLFLYAFPPSSADPGVLDIFVTPTASEQSRYYPSECVVPSSPHKYNLLYSRVS